MKTLAIAFLLTLMTTLTASAADKPKEHKVLFEFTSEGEKAHTAVLTNIENLRKSLGSQTKVTLVAHGAGIALLQKTNTESAEKMRMLSEAGVVFAACENTMKKKNIRKEDLLPFVTTVDSGVAEVVRKQEDGWSYVKSGQ